MDARSTDGPCNLAECESEVKDFFNPFYCLAAIHIKIHLRNVKQSQNLVHSMNTKWARRTDPSRRRGVGSSETTKQKVIRQVVRKIN